MKKLLKVIIAVATLSFLLNACSLGQGQVKSSQSFSNTWTVGGTTISLSGISNNCLGIPTNGTCQINLNYSSNNSYRPDTSNSGVDDIIVFSVTGYDKCPLSTNSQPQSCVLTITKNKDSTVTGCFTYVTALGSQCGINLN